MMSSMTSSTSSPSSSTSKHARRSNRGSIAFDRRTRVYLIPTLEEYTDDEYDQIYFNEADERRNSADIVQSIATMRTGTDEDRLSDEYCPRGLEKMQSSEHMARSTATKARVINSVLDEQDKQWEGHYFDSDCLAEISARHSSNSVEMALLLAESDAAFTRIYNPSSANQQNEEEESSEPIHPSFTSSSSSSSEENSLFGNSSSGRCIQETLSRVLTSPDLTAISTNIATMSSTRRKSAGSLAHRWASSSAYAYASAPGSKVSRGHVPNAGM